MYKISQIVSVVVHSLHLFELWQTLDLHLHYLTLVSVQRVHAQSPQVVLIGILELVRLLFESTYYLWNGIVDLSYTIRERSLFEHVHCTVYYWVCGTYLVQSTKFKFEVQISRAPE